MREHNVELALAGDLEKAVSETQDLVTKFQQDFDKYASTIVSAGGPIWDKGDEALVKYDKVFAIASELAQKSKELGVDPNNIPEYMMFSDFEDDFKREEADIRKAMSILEDIASMVQD